MSKILTKRKAAWVSKRKPDVLRGDPINMPAAVYERYHADLVRLISEMASECETEIKRLFKHEDIKEFFAADATPSSQARILTNYLSKKFMEKFAKKSKPLAYRWAGQADKASSATVHSSIQKLSGGLSLPTSALSYNMSEILEATVVENVNLIKSIGDRYLSQVQQSVMRSITQGTGITAIEKDLQRIKGVTMRRAQIIALDQTQKISNTLARERFQKLGLTHYQWSHTSGSREPRKLHEDYDGRIFEYGKPVLVQKSPATYGYPGTLINCSCRQIPVLKFGK